MRVAFRIGSWLEVRLSSSNDPPPAESELLPNAEAGRWLRWLNEDGTRGRSLAMDLAEALTGHSISERASIADALEIIKQGFVDGRLRAYAQKHVGGGKGQSKEDPPSVRPPSEDKKTFVAISLVTDDADQKPVPFKRYKITLPDSTVREGMLDQNGQAVVKDIDPGTCKVTFPDFDAADWKAA